MYELYIHNSSQMLFKDGVSSNPACFFNPQKRERTARCPCHEYFGKETGLHFASQTVNQ